MFSTIIAVVVLLFPFSAFAVSVQTFSGTPANSVRIADSATNFYTAQQFTATAAGTVTSLKWYHRINDGTPTDGITVQIWTDNGSDSPGSLISGATTNIAQASIVDGGNSWNVSEFTTVNFASPPTVANGTKYWVVTNRQGSIDATNYNNTWVTDPSSYADGILKQGTSAPVWGSTINNDQALIIEITPAATVSSFASFFFSWWW